MRINKVNKRLVESSIVGLIALICALAGAAVNAQEEVAGANDDTIEQIVVTGTRIKTAPGISSASQLTSVHAEEISLQGATEAEQLIRTLPSSIPADNANRNAQSQGVTTVDLRGLGPQRNLILLNNKRLVPYTIGGRVDVSHIPLAMIERVDVVTGGASAVYGSDAMSGVVNFITKRDVSGLDVQANYRVSSHGDAGVINLSAVMGTDLNNDRGNVTLGLTYIERDGIFGGDRDFARFGIVTATGQNLDSAPVPVSPGCEGPNVVSSGGSTWTLPTWMILGGVPVGQYRNDGTLGGLCQGAFAPSQYNFSPENYLETPQEKYNILGTTYYDLTDNVEAYATGLFSHTRVETFNPPSGIIGSQLWTPMSNPLIGDQARDAILEAANARLASGLLSASNWRDLNSDGVVDAADDLNIQYFRRMPELGQRRALFDNSNFLLSAGLRGEVFSDWDWDISYQHGESSRREITSGHAHVPRIADGVQAILDGNGAVVCRSGGAGCLPFDLWGGFGSITPEMVEYGSALTILEEFYTQQLFIASIGGPIDGLQSPLADTPVAVSFGVEYREEDGETIPDNCLRLTPNACHGGPNTLPVEGGYTVKEIFAETIIPVVTEARFLNSLSLELGYRYSDYNFTEGNNTWKAGLSWAPVEDFRIRVMRQHAARAPNVGELAAPITSGISSATLDHCSSANAAVLASNPAMRQLCIDTGVPANLVGVVPNLLSGNAFTVLGTDPNGLPEPEGADTTTAGFIWTPTTDGFFNNVTVSADYYNIEINDFIGRKTPQQQLDDCYVRADLEACSHIRRVEGALLSFESGIELFTTNLDRLRAEGVELGASTGVDLSNHGDLQISLTANRYLTRDSRSDAFAPDVDCLGRFGPRCEVPIHKLRFSQRTTWNISDFQLSYLWRYSGAVTAEQDQIDNGRIFDDFQTIEAQHYFDLSGVWHVTDSTRLSITVNNLLDNDPPLVGNQAGTATTNFANTFPGNYDVLGRVFTLGVSAKF